jgi:hypothetical protein
MTSIIFSKDNFDFFCNSPMDALEAEISRASIRLKLQPNPQTDEDRKIYQDAADHVAVLKHISQFRKGKLSMDELKLKVEFAG